MKLKLFHNSYFFIVKNLDIILKYKEIKGTYARIIDFIFVDKNFENLYILYIIFLQICKNV